MFNRYVEALQHALVLKRPETTPAEYKKHSAALLKEDSDLALLRILECFLEAAPQQVLQITILMTPGSPNVPTVLQSKCLLQVYRNLDVVRRFQICFSRSSLFVHVSFNIFLEHVLDIRNVSQVDSIRAEK